MTKEINCTCKDDFQDKLYGKGKRLCNAYGKPHKGYKCTVCGKEHGKEEKIIKLGK